MFDAFMLCTAQLSAFLRQGRSLACVRSRPSFLSIRTTNINRLNLNQSSWADRLPTICSLLIVKGGRKVRVIQNALIPLESVFNCCELEHAYLDR